jgi:CHASE2 domain-containing sensor protein
MPESPRAANRQLVAIILMISAALLAGAAMLIYTGIVPVQPEMRGMMALVVAVAAVADFGIGLLFFRMGQSS